MAEQISIVAVQVLRNKLYDQKADIEARIAERKLDYETYIMNYESQRERNLETLLRIEGGIGALERLNDATRESNVAVEQAYYSDDHAH